MSFNTLKFLGGFNIFDGEKLAKIVFFTILFVGLTIGYDKLTKETNKTVVREGGTQVINNCPPVRPGCGFFLWKTKIGFMGE